MCQLHVLYTWTRIGTGNAHLVKYEAFWRWLSCTYGILCIRNNPNLVVLDLDIIYIVYTLQWSLGTHQYMPVNNTSWENKGTISQAIATRVHFQLNSLYFINWRKALSTKINVNLNAIQHVTDTVFFECTQSAVRQSSVEQALLLFNFPYDLLCV